MADEAPRLFIGDLLGNYVCRSVNAYEVADKVLAALANNGYVLTAQVSATPSGSGYSAT